MSQLQDLARLTVQVLTLQKHYFRAESGSAEKRELLLTYKREETSLLKMCGSILAQPDQTALFETEGTG